ncbi:hypothetical protein KL86DYS2_12139 [uncultured Dysgonomonas sp.]|uniref:Uncharacterized protein n=1 Tax=uncultured Dysgonomonas sp. TaxID=206096 RepID=A0A212JRD3_9BACT|nr:hypothetical protein KL86DYS2_12139 [uncultured Dysgonomonas sp.]
MKYIDFFNANDVCNVLKYIYLLCGMMYFNELRYNFESKSQLLTLSSKIHYRCISMN